MYSYYSFAFTTNLPIFFVKKWLRTALWISSTSWNLWIIPAGYINNAPESSKIPHWRRMWLISINQERRFRIWTIKQQGFYCYSPIQHQSEHFYNQHWLKWDVSKGSQPAWSGGDEETLGVTCVTSDWHFPSHLNTSSALSLFRIVRLEARQTEKTLPFGSLSCSSSSKKTTPLPNSPKTESTGALRNTKGTV